MWREQDCQVPAISAAVFSGGAASDAKATAKLTIGALLKGLTPKQPWSLLGVFVALFGGAFL